MTKKLFVVGGSINDNESVANPSGVIGAFDVDDGHLVWSWDLGKADPNAPLAPGERFTANTPPAWAPPSVDEALELGRRARPRDRQAALVVPGRAPRPVRP